MTRSKDFEELSAAIQSETAARIAGDQALSQQLTTVRPSEQPFAVAEDGSLIISEATVKVGGFGIAIDPEEKSSIRVSGIAIDPEEKSSTLVSGDLAESLARIEATLEGLSQTLNVKVNGQTDPEILRKLLKKPTPVTKEDLFPYSAKLLGNFDDWIVFMQSAGGKVEAPTLKYMRDTVLGLIEVMDDIARSISD